MVATFHNHTTFCDGKNTPREMVECALKNGARAIGFSSHGYTPFDTRYCLTDESGYIDEIDRLKNEYKDKIEIYLGVEEDAFFPVNRSLYDYVIGSMHYYKVNGEYYPIDSTPKLFENCLELFNYNVTEMAENYYSAFCGYIKSRKPDIIGHFDLITKYDEESRLFLGNENYHKIAEKYLLSVVSEDVLFEVNVGAMLRGYRKSPYPYDNLLHKINKQGGNIILSLDAHSINHLSFDFSNTIKYLKDIGFNSVYTLKSGKFVKENI